MQMDAYLLNDMKKTLNDVALAIDAAGDKSDSMLGAINKTLKAINSTLQDCADAIRDNTKSLDRLG